MSETFSLKAQARNDLGKGASRRLRREQGFIPAILYGAGKESQSITLEHKEIWKAQESEAFYTAILSIDIDGKVEKAVIKDIQRHPAKNIILHCDFLRVDAQTEITINIPLHFINEETCYGVKMQGGSITHSEVDVEVRCLPKDVPSFIEVDMSEYQTGAIVHISDLKLPEGVESVALSHGEDHDLAIAQVLAPRGSQGDDEDAAADGDSTDADEATEE